MEARSRVVVVVAVAATAAVAATVGATLLQTHGEHKAAAPGAAVTKPRAGTPPLVLDFGVRADPEARALAQAANLYAQGKLAAAGAIFRRYDSLEAQIGAAFATWKQGGGLDRMKRLVATHPRSALAELHLGLAYLWAGRNADAVTALRQALKVEPDSPAAVAADDALHSAMPPGLPFIVTGLKPPAVLTRLPAAQELAALARAAERPDANAKLLYGVALWNLRRPVSAERQFAAAAKLAPHDPVALTAAAVGVFTKGAPVRAFSRLGPLTGVFPRAAVVRFHLGVLLLWTGEFAKARTQLRLAVKDGRGTVYSSQATRLLAALGHNGTK